MATPASLPPMTEPSPEYAVLQLAAQAAFGDSDVSTLAARVDEGLDWQHLYAEATRHGLLARLYARLTASVASPPADAEGYERLMRSLHRAVGPYTALTLFLTAEMRALAGVFERAELPYLVLKGPSLAEAYGGLGYRPFVDNDLLVRRDDFARVDAALHEAGFEREQRSPSRLRGYLYVHGEVTYWRRVTGQTSTLDVHTALVPPGLSYRESFDALRARARDITVAGTPVPALSWEDLLIALAVNGLKDQWRRLRLISDVAAVATMITDWPAVERRARAAGSLRTLHVALLLAAREVASPPPAPVLRRAEADLPADRLATWVSRHLHLPSDDGTKGWADRARLSLRSQDRWTGRLRYASFVAFRRLTERYVDPHGVHGTPPTPGEPPAA